MIATRNSMFVLIDGQHFYCPCGIRLFHMAPCKAHEDRCSVEHYTCNGCGSQFEGVPVGTRDGEGLDVSGTHRLWTAVTLLVLGGSTLLVIGFTYWIVRKIWF